VTKQLGIPGISAKDVDREYRDVDGNILRQGTQVYVSTLRKKGTIVGFVVKKISETREAVGVVVEFTRSQRMFDLKYLRRVK
jgi:hypothetical protein